jgi:hypothetical protein
LKFNTIDENRLITDKSNFAGNGLWSEIHASPNLMIAGTSGTRPVTSATQFVTGVWYYIVFNHFATSTAGGLDMLYVNGVLDVAPNWNVPSADNNNDWRIMGNGSADTNGTMDELRLTNISHTAGWIRTEYNNQRDVSSFLSITDEEPILGASYEGVVNIPSLPDRGSSTDSTLGYKWQVMVCNEEDLCSYWDQFNTSLPNLKVDTRLPSAPGDLTLATTTATSITLDFGGSTNEANFAYYKIFYKSGLAGVDTEDTEHVDANLTYIDYNSAATTTITGLDSDTQYVINIWAYDLAGNKTAATEIVVNTQTAPHARARSVQFLAGTYSSANGLSGQLTNTNQSFSTFNFRLPEVDVDIRSAYVLFESQFEAYHANSSDYSGYQLSFDVCQESCTADASSSLDRVFKDSDSVLAYNETDGNQVRLLLDVTNETQLAAYAGGGTNMEAQVGYRLKTNTATSSIASAKATLVITYAYNNDASTSTTNTVIYPLESTGAGDSGTRRASTTDECTKNSNCPVFSYNMNIPEFSTRLSQWFSLEGVSDGHGTNDALINANIQTYDVDSNTFYHEAANGGEQGNFPSIIFTNIYGFSESTSQNLEYYASSPGAAVYYLQGGEVVETYTAPKSAAVKTRTVSFPIGVISNGQSLTTATGTANVYFPENGSGSGIVDIKKAWFRAISNNYLSGNYSLTLSSKVGDNSRSSNYAYNINAGDEIIKPSYKVIHVIPSADYTELETANADEPVIINVYSTNSSVNMGGVSAELMITYTYTDESSGYLSSLNLFGGQSDDAADSQSRTESVAAGVFPEMRGTETVLSAGLLGSFHFNDSDGDMPSAWFTMDTNLAASGPGCNPTAAFSGHSDGMNAFIEYYDDVTASLLPTDEQTYSVCYANTNASAATAGAKMNSVLLYTYRWDAPPPEITENDWRWYVNNDSISPTTPKAAENTAITGINAGDILRLRMNIGITNSDLATSTQTFKLQYAPGSDCASISSTTWKLVGGVAGSDVWRGYNNPDPVDGTQLSSVLLSTSDVRETYEETNPSASNPRQIMNNQFGEWDWVLYNNYATSTTDYCFRMVKGNGSEFDSYISDSYARLTTAASNTAPSLASGLKQSMSNNYSPIANLAWINRNSILLTAQATDPNMSENVTLYFQLASSTATLTTATTTPTGACVYGTAYNSCASKVWFAAPGAPSDFRVAPFIGTTSITALPDYNGYQWQVLACDDGGACSNWVKFNVSKPNFRVDTTAPTKPGNLTIKFLGSTSLYLQFGASTTERYFSYYRIFYKVGTSGVKTTDNQHTDTNLNYQDYGYSLNGATSTFVDSLSADTQYVFNIWAYDMAGNMASATLEVATTTKVSFNPPTGSIVNLTQATDGTGAVQAVIVADDPDNNDTLRAQMFFEAGNTCTFSTINKINVDPSDEKTFATYGDPKVDNQNKYQVGTTTGWIMTSPGPNYVIFDWLSKINAPAANGTYCLGLVVNDGAYNQVATHTKLIIVDNFPPTTPGRLATTSKDYDSVVLGFGSQSTDTRFDRYRIFYKIGTAGVDESDTEHIDSNMDDSDYKGAATTTVSGLLPNTEYVFNIWAYDLRGNKSSSTEVRVKTNAKPINISADNQYLSDGVTAITNGSWISSDSVMLKSSVHDQDAGDLVTFYYELISATGTHTVSTNVPSSACANGVEYLNCQSKIWAVSTTSSSLPSDWYNEDWLYRKRITIDADQVEASMNDFPVMVRTTDSDLAADARSDALDILFTDSGGTSTLRFEIENYNSSTGELLAWVKTNVSSTTDKTIYMYYGNSAANTDMSTTTGVWDANFVGIWHLDENVVDESNQANAHQDSTFYDNDGDQYGNSETTAMMFRGQDFDGLNDYIEVSDSSSLDVADAVTMSFWINGSVTNPPTASTTIRDTAGSGTFVVPAGVTSLKVRSWGGGGGGGAGIDGGTSNTLNSGGSGGGAGYAEAVITVEPGETISLNVGGGGGGGQVGASSNGGGGGGGGGRSEVARGSTPLVVASGGGGGGGANDRQYSNGGGGGAGGALTGVSGSNSGTAIGGGGGTQSAGGSAGTGSNTAQAGASRAGGDGADGRSTNGVDGSGATGGAGAGGDGGLGDAENRYPGGGGGGSGYYGGGGGGVQSSTNNAGAGGGGGSSYVVSGSTATTTEAGSGRSVANSDDSYYSGSLGVGGLGGSPASAGASGNTGRIVLEYTPAVTVIGKGSNAYQVNLNDSSKISGQINGQSVNSQLSAGWHYITLSYDRSAGGTTELKLYIDGAVVDSADYSTVITTNNEPITIGELIDGSIDELQISKVARSQAWIETSYNNQKSNSNFLSFSTESTVVSYYESSLIINIPDNPSYASGYKWQVMACDDDRDCSGWDKFNLTTPNIKIDTTDPSAPGQLVEQSKSSNSITLSFGAATNEANFSEYKIFYSTTSPVTELKVEHDDPNLSFKNYNGAATTQVTGLSQSTTYYFNIWAYDVVGHKASSTMTTITTSAAISTPGVMFYTKNNRAVYYRVWTGLAWGAEQNSGNLTTAGDNIRHIRAIRSDDGGKVGLLLKTWDGTNQEWYGTVFRYAANDFVNATRLGSAEADALNNHLITGCIAPLSGGEFMVVRNNNASAGTLVYSWNPVDGWVTESAGPDPAAIVNGCELVRRPGTDNYILMTFDDDSDVGSAYYYGGSAYANSWTGWTQHSSDEDGLENYVGQAFFDPSNNTRGALNFSNSNTNNYTYAKYFSCDNTSISYGGQFASPSVAPADWGNDFVHGEFAADPGGTGVAYFVGRDTGGQLNAYKVDASTPTITWSSPARGDNMSSSTLYSETNYSQKPFASMFYRSGKALVTWARSSGTVTPVYKIISSSGNSLSAATSSVSGAGTNNYVRVRLFDDPNADELVAIYQNDDVDYSAVFFDGGNDTFYSSGNSAWNELVTLAGPFDRDDECTSYAFTGYNSAPNQPSNLAQSLQATTSTISNGAWVNRDTVRFTAKVTDYDTSEIVTLYLQLLANTDTFAASTTRPASPCAQSVNWDNCTSKFWSMGTSTLGDYSYTPFTATATITSIDDSSIGYKWQVIACDDSNVCSAWKKFNLTTPNFNVDTTNPSAPGRLTITAKTSSSVTLQFGAQTNETNFSRYRIFYKQGASGVTELNLEHNDADLLSKTYGGTANTIVVGLSSSTQYVFNIWAYDLAGNKASATPEVATTTNALPKLAQRSFLIENDDGTDVNSNTAEVTASTTLTNVYVGTRLNARIQIENYGGDPQSNTVYKLQYENNTDSPGTWNDVGAATVISYSLGLSGDNGYIITSRKAAANATNWVNGTWHEGTNNTGSFTLANNSHTEFVFAVKTGNASPNKTYRLRLYNVTDNRALDAYNNYPRFTTANPESLKYSKGSSASLSANTSDLSYFLDPEGYADVATNDNTNLDKLVSAASYPVFNYSLKNSNNTNAITLTWNGSSTVSTAVNNFYLQVYRFGTTNAWQTLDTEGTAGAYSEFVMSGNVNAQLSEYYDGSNRTYWRVYQGSGTQTVNVDYARVATSTPVPETSQIHYRWRKDNGTQLTATWLEAEDAGNPTTGANLGVGSSTRLRVAVANVGGGDATSYTYRLEYASSTDGCVANFSTWTTVPSSATNQAFEMQSSTYFADGDTTTATTTNAEGYTFVAGRMVEDPSNTTAGITLSERRYTELEYMILVSNNAIDAATYCFRVSNAGTALNNYSRYPVVTLSGNTNNAPTFSTYPSDNGSASTSPTNIGDSVNFTATGQDSDANNYYLAVCRTNSISPGVDGPPTCNGGNWCISGSTASGGGASCNYTTATSTENLNWYAFVCDKIPGFGIAKCSASSQGTGSSADRSPFVINHRPNYTSVSTTANNKNPGQSITITAYVQDNDVSGSADTLRLYVCSSNSIISYAAGCTDTTICSQMSTTSPDAACSFTPPIPSAATTSGYYAFVYDSHGLLASPNSRYSTYTINNTPPSLGNLVLNNGGDITLNIRGAIDKAVSAVSGSISDLNGCQDIDSAVGSIYLSSVANAQNCTANNNNCYQISVANCAISCAGAAYTVATTTCSAQLKYYAIPTDDLTNNPNEEDNWKAYIQLYDGANYVSTTSAGVEMKSTLALSVVEEVIDFGSNMAVGQNTGNSNSTTTVENSGNSPIDTNISGTNLNGQPSGVITVNYIKYNLVNFNYPTETNTLATTNKFVDIVGPRATTTSGIDDEIYWGISIPYGSEPNAYFGHNYFQVILDSDNW